MTRQAFETPADLQRAMRAEFPASAEQWAAIKAPLGPAVVVAGAGSGKTTLMAARVVYLVLTGQVRPEQVLGLTFTTKAASELRKRIREALINAGALSEGSGDPDAEGDAFEPTVATYNAYAANLLSEHGLRVGHEPDTRVITDAARYQLGARAVDRFSGDVSFLSDHPETVILNLLALDGAMSEHLVTADDVRRVDAEARAGFDRALAEEVAGKNRKGHKGVCEKGIFAIDRRGELLELVAAYRRLKRDLGLMDFSDQIELGARLAAEQPEVGAIERDKFRVVMLDEYQDTSVAQAIMLSRLFSGPLGAGLGHPVTAVGDPNQAIYGWRGASVSNILNFGDSFAAADGEPELFHLTINRRSDRDIVSVANRLATELYEKFPQVAPLQAPDYAGEGLVETAVYETRELELDALVESVRRAGGTGTWAKVGVLTRDNSHAGLVFDALTSNGIPVEIVGLAGLLRLPEVAEIVATLHLLHDVTSNAAMLTLLTGPRWAIGPRDLRLLSQRAAALAGGNARESDLALDAQLMAIADGIDPAEIPALDDAISDPGDGAYSTQARERFALLAQELRMLRRHLGEPLLDLVRRIIDASGVDVELSSATTPGAPARRDNLDIFVKAVADFQAVDGDVSLPALLAYLTAEDEQGNGLDAATPSEADSVKLLTVHRAKGLEWDSVFVVGVCEGRFPSTVSRHIWVASPEVLPTPLRGDAPDLPQVQGYDKDAIDAYRAAVKADEYEGELRLGYVAFTRAAHHLSVTSFNWSPRATPFGPSKFQQCVREHLEDSGRTPTQWLVKPDRKVDPNPYSGIDPAVEWPTTSLGVEAGRRLEAAARVRAADATAPDDGLDVVAAAQVAEWDDEIDRLLAEARRDRQREVDVELPGSLSATSLARLRDQPETFARELARPMPRQPSTSARFGTRFHAWVEGRFGQQALLDPDQLSGRADVNIDDDPELAAQIEAFEAGDFAERLPIAVEPSFALVLGEQVIRGRIDAVYREPDGRFLLVDWKTNQNETAEPLQLSLYRLAWAELHDVDVEQVRAAFYYVRSGRLVEPADLLSRAELVDLVATPDRDRS